MDDVWPTLSAILALPAAIMFAVWLVRWTRRAGQEIVHGRANEAFVLERERLAERFREAAEALGKPRGLRWVRCELGEAPLLIRERFTGRLLGLVSVTIHFEAIPGSDMEDVAAVGLPRDATAVFVFRAGRWETEGRAVFNLGPEQVLQRFGDGTAQGSGSAAS